MRPEELHRMSTDTLWEVLKRVEDTGKLYKEALAKGQEFYRQPLEQQRARWKAIKAEIDSRTQKAGLAAAAPPAAPAPVTPKAFHNMLAQHDWGHEYSDDPAAYRAGKESADKIASIVRAQPELTPILNLWRAHLVAGGKRPEEPA